MQHLSPLEQAVRWIDQQDFLRRRITCANWLNPSGPLPAAAVAHIVAPCTGARAASNYNCLSHRALPYVG